VSAEHEFSAADAAALIRVPTSDDDKYSRGVLGMITGSHRYPGAAVIGVEAALRTGVGMVRYRGAARAADFVLQRRPEAVSADGRVQAWVLGSGMDAGAVDAEGSDSDDAEVGARLRAALASGNPLVIDAGALDAVARAAGPTIVTPHARELSRLLEVTVEHVRADPLAAARAAATRFDVAVLVKGHATRVVAPDGAVFVARSAPAWLATAGAGDALAGILGALVATHAAAATLSIATLARLGATAAVVHGLAAQRASAGGPLTVLDLCAAVHETIAELVQGRHQ
jgi:hydroxyethylthiazole kinase-like uncharacterized protein yjeF